jgi:hypothetical protein
MSPVVHLFPSSHDVPLGLLPPPVHNPEAELQVPAVVQAPAPPQTTGLLPVQAPAWQVSVCVQALPSLQVVPSAATGLLQAPVDSRQTPGVWQAAGAAQVIGEPPQEPLLQTSPVVHFRPSSHIVPLGLGVPPVHKPDAGLQVPAVVQAEDPEH